jgi:transcriptional regulator with XRE-family HTH domain
VAALEAIRARREGLHLSRIELARRAGVSFSHLSNIEQGAVPRGGHALDRIPAALDDAEREA